MKLSKLLIALEEEAISIIRDSFSKSSNPVMMYSIGKDSSVLLHLARKAFYPSPVPFPLLHIDTGWKFKEMIRFKEKIIKKYQLQIITHINISGVKKNINPFNHKTYTDIMKTDALKEALDNNRFDVIYGGARRDEEASRSKERVVSVRESNHSWDPKNQRPELFGLYNYHKSKQQSLRVFPISNWTEEDIWNYILSEKIEIVDLYFSKVRPTVQRDGAWFMVDDDRFPLQKGEIIIRQSIRFRTLGCYPLTAGTLSTAKTIPQIILENKKFNYSERSGRLIDHDKADSMEAKKKMGYF
jgi:sulfate adenylyltransferase subunit 2